MNTSNKTEICVPPNNKKIQLEIHNDHDWDFYYLNEHMMPSKEMDELTKEVKVHHLPEVFYGYNRLIMVNKANEFYYEISPIDLINLTSYEVRKAYLNKDLIYYDPVDAKVQYHSTWKDIKIDRDDIRKTEPVEDWSYSSSYMGSYGHISNSPLNSIYNSSKDSMKEFKVLQTSQQLPIERLGRDNPILKYIEINLFEDELNDFGLSEAKFRFRIMKDCFYGLLRSYLRIDNVMVRIIDTRIFHSFGDKDIIRNFFVKEATYDQLKSIGFDCSSNWSMSHNQSDVVNQKIETPLLTITDLITIVKE